MKKRLGVLAAILLLTASLLCSCGTRLSGLTAAEAYSAARDTLGSAEKYEIITERRVTSTDGVELISSERSTYRRYEDRFYMQNANSTNPLLNMEGWYVDGFSYASYPSMKVKTPVDREKYLDMYAASADGFLPMIGGDLFDGLKFEKQDGAHILTMRLSAAQYLEVAGEVGIGGEIDGEVIMEVTFDENAAVTGTVVSYYMYVSGTRVYSVSSTSIAYNTEKITAPENANEFELVG